MAEYEITDRDLANISAKAGVHESNGRTYYQVTIGNTDYWAYDPGLLQNYLQLLAVHLKRSFG